MNAQNKSGLLARAANRARVHHEYLGWFLGRYAEAEEQTDQDLADYLGASMSDFYRLFLCLRPRRGSFSSDVQQIANKFGLDAGDLARVVRYVEALEGMKDERVVDIPGEAGLLMAARARKNKPGTSAGRKKHDNRPKS
jgi:hypothetical protein